MRIILTAITLLQIVFLSAQEIMEIEGAIRIESSDEELPQKGTIRFNPETNDFEGWNGAFWTSLTGLQFEYIGQVTDADGNVYPTVKIGDQEWMARNLRTTTYHDRNRTPIPFVGHDPKDDNDWSSLSDDAYSYFDTSGTEYQAWSIEQFGNLYNWFAVVDSRNLCPVGWRIPSSQDWLDLINNNGGTNSAGGSLKMAGLAYWLAPNLGADNRSGFAGLPSGGRFGSFSFIGTAGLWWSSSGTTQPGLENEAIRLRLDHGTEEASLVFNTKQNGYSVRCVKD